MSGVESPRGSKPRCGLQIVSSFHRHNAIADIQIRLAASILCRALLFFNREALFTRKMEPGDRCECCDSGGHQSVATNCPEPALNLDELPHGFSGLKQRQMRVQFCCRFVADGRVLFARLDQDFVELAKEI